METLFNTAISFRTFNCNYQPGNATTEFRELSSSMKGLEPRSTHHMFPACHKPFIDDLCGVISSRVDMYTFLYNRVGPSAQCFASLVATGLHLRLLLRLLLLHHAILCLDCHCGLTPCLIDAGMFYRGA